MSDVRSVVPVDTKTIRSQVTDAYMNLLANAPWLVDDPLAPGYVKLFDRVIRGTLDDLMRKDTPCAAIEEGDETPLELLWPFIDKRLTFYVHVKVVSTLGLDQTDLINYYLARIVQLFLPEQHLANLTLGIREAGNSIQTNGINDPEPGGTIWFEVDYRHNQEDPFNRS